MELQPSKRALLKQVRPGTSSDAQGLQAEQGSSPKVFCGVALRNLHAVSSATHLCSPAFLSQFLKYGGRPAPLLLEHSALRRHLSSPDAGSLYGLSLIVPFPNPSLYFHKIHHMPQQHPALLFCSPLHLLFMVLSKYFLLQGP